MENLQPNPGKNLVIEVNGERYVRLPIRTQVITKQDNILEVVKEYAQPHIQPGDRLFISERIVAISQGRAYPISEIKPSRLAKFLVKFVTKSPYGIGLGSPWTMELAIREAGMLRMILGALAAVLTKPFGIRGVFYKVVGKNINAIDGPCDYTLPPYNHYAKLGPRQPDKVARSLKAILGVSVVIIDANDLGVAILGQSDPEDSNFYRALFKDNPLGQTNEQTPMAIVRKIS